ncbi:uncharacterized protein LOC124885731 [Capsicum annuum]|uniref:uncharacterized protein LOC124885731 n=1 Tax=Capsicum annuum TaxID=4072 RepID=UPI001FB0A7BD|nr:uncharacterized protein LOC124885731 [Capsicum annuum]
MEEPLCLIDLGYGFFTAKFNIKNSKDIVLQGRSWIVAGSFISIWKWEPNFVPRTSKIDSTVIWVCLPQLLTKFYDRTILERIGRRIWKLLKVDSCTSSTIRGRYAQICIQVELGKPVKTSVTIGNHKQLLVYEAERILYKLCGCLSHVAMSRPNKKVFPSSENSSPPKTSAPIMDHKEEWKIVTFQRKRNAKKSTASNPTPANHNRGNGVKNAMPEYASSQR